MSRPIRISCCRPGLAGLVFLAVIAVACEIRAADSAPAAADPSGAPPPAVRSDSVDDANASKDPASEKNAAGDRAVGDGAVGDGAPASESELPPPLKAYKGRRIADTMHYTGASWLMRDVREREEDCSMLLEALGLKAGQSVCDMGCGNGFYSLKMARLVGERGQVIGVDIQQEMLRMLEARAKNDDLRNIKLVLGGPADPRLAESSVDLILLVDVYHEFSYPEHMLRAMRRSLKPGGRVALAEFRLEDRNVPIKLLHKMTKKQILKEFEPNGFRLVEEFDELPWQHLMFFMRDDDPAAEGAAKEKKPPSGARPAEGAKSRSAPQPAGR